MGGKIQDSDQAEQGNEQLEKLVFYNIIISECFLLNAVTKQGVDHV